MSNIAIITARSGSKGLKDKNIRLLNGKPLIAYSIAAAKESGKFDTIFVSTDSEEYARIAIEYGADAHFLRSKKLSSDSAGSWDVIREVIFKFEEMGSYFDKIMLLQPTSPLRTALDIENAFDLMHKKKANTVIGVTEVDHSPLWSNTLGEDGSMSHFFDNDIQNKNRQMLEQYYRINGAIYLVTRKELENRQMFIDGCYAYIMPRERSIDIDTLYDFRLAEFIMQGCGCDE